MPPQALTAAQALSRTHSSSKVKKSVDGPYIRSEQLWFEDGSIILLSQNVLFKVYRGTLARQSAVFRDMLSFPQPTSPNLDTSVPQMIDGCPVVRVYDDPVDELTPFLKALFDSSFFDGSPTCEFITLLPILVLATKYDVPFLRQRAITHFAKLYPTTLTEWDNRFRNPPFEVFDYVPFFVIPIARAHSLDYLLPAALYDIATSTVSQIFEHTTVLEGTVFEHTSMEKMAVFTACQTLATATRNRLLAFLKAPAATDCEAELGKCELGKLQWLRLGEDEMFGPFDRGFQWEDYEDYVCSKCLEENKKDFERAREKLWEELPSFFNLPSWDVLKKQATGL